MVARLRESNSINSSIPKKKEMATLKALIFDLDGVITKTAAVHEHAWKLLFDEYLRTRAEPFQEFTESDYLKFVDGKPRYNGVESFLKSRGIELARGDPTDAPGNGTICALGNQKNVYFRKVLDAEGVSSYESTVRLIRDARAAGIRVGVASSSANAGDVLARAGLSDLIEARVDGVVSAAEKLAGKPAPDIFVTCAARLGCTPSEAIVFEDATSGVAAGKAGKFALTVGLNRGDAAQGAALREHGADVVWDDVGEHTLDDLRALAFP